jgi:nucleotide-binding universal stress UspA family protein
MTSFRDRVPASDAETRMQPAFTRVLVCVQDASQVEQAVELARRASVPGTTEVRVLHLNLRENIGGRRFRLETKSAASYVVEAAVFELRMADLGASGEIRAALIDRAADAIVAEATDWGADLIVLGSPRRGELMTRLFGSVTLRVLQHAPCPVLAASARDRGGPHRIDEQQHAGHRS